MIRHILRIAHGLDELVGQIGLSRHNRSSNLSRHIRSVRIETLIAILESNLQREHGGRQVVGEGEADRYGIANGISAGRIRCTEILLRKNMDRNIPVELVAILRLSLKTEGGALLFVTDCSNLQRYFLPFVGSST